MIEPKAMNYKLFKKLEKLEACKSGIFKMFKSGFHAEDFKNIKEIRLEPYLYLEDLIWFVQHFKLSMTIREKSAIGDPDDVFVYKKGQMVSALRHNSELSISPQKTEVILDKSNRKKEVWLNDLLSETYDYDDFGNLVEVRKRIGTTDYWITETLKYDKNGNCILTSNTNHLKEITQEVHFKYNENGLLVEKRSFPGNYIVSYKYDEAGRDIERNSGDDNYLITRYDEKGRPAYKETNTTHICYSYHKDNLIKKEVTISGKSYTMFFTYDEKGRLLRVFNDVFGDEEVYAYDEDGNIIQMDFYYLKDRDYYGMKRTPYKILAKWKQTNEDKPNESNTKNL